LKKQKHSDFYFKLNNLKDRIEVYKEIFQTRVPRYLRRNHRYLDERVHKQEDLEGEQPEPLKSETHEEPAIQQKETTPRHLVKKKKHRHVETLPEIEVLRASL